MRKSDHKYDQIPAVCEQNINYCWSDHEQQLFNCYWRDLYDEKGIWAESFISVLIAQKKIT